MAGQDDRQNEDAGKDQGLSKAEAEKLGLNVPITRRDFMGSTLLGAGAALLGMACPAAMRSAAAQTTGLPLRGLGPEWTGPGGIGDYSKANGDTHEMVNAAHAGIRNREFDKYLATATETGETFDLLIVGAGCSGLSAGYIYHKERPNSSVMILENAPIFGGEARRNEIEVDGVRLYGAQGPTVYRTYPESQDIYCALNSELGFPEEIEWGEVTGLIKKDLVVPHDMWSPMGDGEREQADVGYFYDSKGWVINPWQDGFRRAPIPDKVRRDLVYLQLCKRPPYRPEGDAAAVDRWLDSITYLELLTKYFKVDPGVIPYVEEALITGFCGMGADVLSAYYCKYAGRLGMRAYDRDYQKLTGFSAAQDGHYYVEVPGGNASVARTLVHKLIPGVFKGDTWTDIYLNAINWDALDRPNQPVRIRVSSTVLAVAHDGPPDSATSVVVTYLNDGKLYKLRGKAVIMSTFQHINKHVCLDIPKEYREAMNEFRHGPQLIVNVAVRNWKFMEKVGISAARWFGDIGWFTSVSRHIKIDGRETMPCDPRKPTILPLYCGFNIPGIPYPQQVTASRMKLFGMPYAEIERKVRVQFNKMFASAGFDAKRDIAGIIANRQGHSQIVCPPGFTLGKNGKPPPREVINKRYNRIAFGHSELNPNFGWDGCTIEGRRAAHQIMEVV